MSKNGKVVCHEGCPKCGSKDNVAVYSTGYRKCFGMGCGYYSYEPETTPVIGPKNNGSFIQGTPQELPKRSISKETCAKWGYHVGEYKDSFVQIANYYDKDKQLVAQKIRTADKKFFITGDISKATLYGEWLWGTTAKRVVVTEGEIDALSVSEVQNNQWPVVSVPNGAASAANAIRKSLEFLERFEEVVFMFDSDEPGRKAALECAELLSPGKARIATLPVKDPNEMIVASRGRELISAIFTAKVHRPDGILSVDDVWSEVTKEIASSTILYPWAGLNNMTRGLRSGELVTVTAGSGIGKSLFVKEIANTLLASGQTVGYIALEESVRTTALNMMGLLVDKPLHLDKDLVDAETFKKAFEKYIGGNKIHFYDHFGSHDTDNLLSRIRYMARGLNCGWIILDHISIVVSGISDGDERRIIDNLMTKLRSLVQETGVGLIIVSHLKRPSGDLGHEDGARTAITQLRGSAAIAQLSDMVIGLERNQQGADDESNPTDPNVSKVRVLKNRYTGEDGVACYLHYNKLTGRLSEIPAPTEVGVFGL